jgi:Transposase C of IS166 homeodomain
MNLMVTGVPPLLFSAPPVAPAMKLCCRSAIPSSREVDHNKISKEGTLFSPCARVSCDGDSSPGRIIRLRRLDLLEKYGSSAETLSDEQLELLKLEPGVSTNEVEAESQRIQLSLPLKSAQARRNPGRRQLPAELPREEQIIACTPDQCVCGNCGKETTVIGYETSNLRNSMLSRLNTLCG